MNTLFHSIKHITIMTYLKFNCKLYEQKYGIPMGNPLSWRLACLFLEYLESGPFKYRLPNKTTYFRYVDDILIFLSQNVKIDEIAKKNNVEPSIIIAYERESNNTLPFRDILIIKSTPTPPKRLLHSFLLPLQQKNQNRSHNWLLHESAYNTQSTIPRWRIWVHRTFPQKPKIPKILHIKG